MNFLISQKSYPKKMVIHPERCTRVHYTPSKCNKCLSVCLTSAIHIKEKGIHISSECNGCEFCVQACPYDVFSADRRVTHDNANDKDKQGRLYCSNLIPEAVEMSGPLPDFIVPCLGSIPDHFILDCFIERESPIELITGVCHDCPMKDGRNFFDEKKKEILAIFHFLNIGIMPFVIRMGGTEDNQSVRYLYESFRKDQEGMSALSRRDFFRNFRSHLLATQKKDDQVDRIGIDAEPRENESTKHLRSLTRIFKKYHTDIPCGKPVPGFFQVEIHETCTGCSACVAICPTGALVLKKSQSDAELIWSPVHCIQCRLCAEVCSKDAVRFRPFYDAEAIVNETQKTVKRLYRHICRGCRREYISNNPEASCVHCLKETRVIDDVSRMIYGEGPQRDPFDEYR